MAKQKLTKFSLKDHLFNADRVQFLAKQFYAADRRFDADRFTNSVMKRLKEFELKQRIVHIAEVLERFLADDFQLAARQIIAALPAELDPTKNDDDFGDFIMAPLGEFVVRRGMATRHVAMSLRTLKEITKRFSMEDALRAFINAHPEKTLCALDKWSTDRNYHVRRLVSESTRPRLPWSGRLNIDHRVPLPLLEKLHSDPTRYVTRSVANHLNDIAKVDPGLVLETLVRWRKAGRQNPAELEWMCQHALRTLIKQGHPQTMKFIGVRTSPKVVVSPIELSQVTIAPGQSIEFTVTITALRDESLVVDYVIDFVKASGSHSPKVFKAKKLQLQRGQSITISKRHPLRADATTYKIFPGTHRLTIQINGRAWSSATFDLAAP